MTHTCKACGKSKPLTAFRKKFREGPLEPWNLRVCKDCVHEEYLERYADPEKREHQKEYARNWKKSNPERHAELAREYRKRNAEKIIAQNRLNYAVRMGRVEKLPCETCGTTEKVHAHHVSYKPEDWYNVRWLCFKCHKLHHTEPDYIKAAFPAQHDALSGGDRAMRI